MGVDDDSCIDGSKKMTPFQSLVRDRGISLKEISEATGIGYSTLGNYNQGSRSPNANKPNATISIELVKELYSIREKKVKPAPGIYRT